MAIDNSPIDEVPVSSNQPQSGVDNNPIDETPVSQPTWGKAAGIVAQHPFQALLGNTVATPYTPTGMIQRGLNIAGEKTAEFGGRHNMPVTGGTAGGIVANLPILAAMAGASSPEQLPQAGEDAAQWIQRLATAGSRIGQAEKAAGVITKAAEAYPTSGNIGTFLNNLEDQLDAGALKNPQQLQQAKDAMEYVFKNPNIVGKTKGITTQAARISNKVSNLFNDPNIVPGRAAPSTDFQTMKTITKPLDLMMQALKLPAQHPLQTGAYLAAAATLKHLLGLGK
jgi:hypothetical protein